MAAHETEGPKPPGKAHKKRGWAGLWWGIGLFLLLLAVSIGAGAWLLIRTQPGHDFVLRMSLRQLERQVNGSVTVDALRSDGLLEGFTLHGVSVADRAGRPFVDADSLRVRYSISALLRRQIVLVPADVWRPRVVIESLHGDAESNVARLFASDEAAADSTVASAWSFALRETAIHDGELVLRFPVEEESDGEGVYERWEGLGAGTYRVLRFESIDAEIAEADLMGPGRTGQEVRFDDLAFVGHLLAEPVVVTGLRGRVLREGEEVRLDMNPLTTPGTEVEGEARVAWGDGRVEIEVDAEAPRVALEDFRWLEPRLPVGGGSLSIIASGPVDSIAVRITDADLRSGESRVRGQIGLDLGDDLRLVETDVRLDPLALRDLDPWTSEPLPFGGELRGTLVAEGLLRSLRVEGDLEFEDAAAGVPASSAQVSGMIGLGDPFRVSGLSVVLDPLRFQTLSAFFPDLDIQGEGRLTGTVTGDLTAGMQIEAVVEHQVEGGTTSVVALSGAIGGGEETVLDLSGTMGPLSLDGIAAGFGTELPVSGDITGTLRLAGPLSDLVVSGSLETPGGPLEATARVNARDPFRGYRVEGRVDGFALAELVSGVPEGTMATGTFFLDGSGSSVEELNGVGELALEESRFGRLDVDAVGVRVRAQDGRLAVDELEIESPLLTASGSGELGLRDGEGGQVSLVWTIDSLSSIRPMVFGDEDIVADTLTELEREVLRIEGIDPDILGASGRLALEGRATGEAVVRGTVRDLEAEGSAYLIDAAYRGSTLIAAQATLTASWHGSEDWDAGGSFEFEGASIEGFDLAQGSGEVTYGVSGGTFDVALRGAAQESYAAAGAFAQDSLGFDVELASLVMEAPETEWRLEGATSVRVQGSMLSTDGLRLLGAPDPASPAGGRPAIAARGVIDLQGASDFALSVESVELGRVARVTQSDFLPGGLLDLEVEVRGLAEAPEIEGDFRLTNLEVGEQRLTTLEGVFDYQGRELETRVIGADGGSELIRIEGRFPIDLSFGEVEDRFLDREMDFLVAVDSLPASTAFATLTVLEEVEGTLDGQVRFLGSRGALRPAGEVTLTGGAFSIPDIGLNLTAIGANFRVREDFAVEVEAEGSAGGRAQVTGTMQLDDPIDPVFDLRISAANFQAIERRDLTVVLGGNVSLNGTYNGPLIGGNVTVQEGELFLDEFVRGAEVIDLNDPRFMDVVDTTIVADRPVAAPAENPFMRNLRVAVGLSFERDFWIRSRESTQGMDVEIAGNLAVTFDRPSRELLLNGTLQAVRGSYAQFGRQFEVQSGVLEFPGTPGIDPSLAIAAIYRLRREGAQALNIVANVGGTLQDPQVNLSSDSQPPIPESDLISYLLFGRPSYALASGEDTVFREALTGVVGYGVSQLGSSVGRSLGVDYLSISQAQRQPGEVGTDWASQFADTQIEMGRYLGDEVFASISLRPLTGLAGSVSRTQLPSLRLEWAFAEFWSMEGFVEDRLTRQGGSGFTELYNDPQSTYGLSIFREWGY